MCSIGSLPWYGWAILIIAVVGLLAAAIWLLWLGRRPNIPSGFRKSVKRGKYNVITVIQYKDHGPLDKISVACALAVWATGRAWSAVKKSPDSEIEHVCVYFTDDDLFEGHKFKSLKKAAAFLVHTGASVGNGIPMAVIRSSIVPEVLETSEPVIHEMLHALLGESSEADKDRDHSDPVVWAANGGGVQLMARGLFKKNVASIR